MKILISMLVGSPRSEKALVEKSISSILSNIGTDDFLLVVGISSSIPSKIVRYIKEVELKNRNIKVTFQHCSSFAEFTNYVFSEYGMTSNWFIVSHDDIELKTKNLIGCVEKSLDSLLDKVGWVSFTDDDYLNGHWAPSVREGFHDDAMYENSWKRRKLFQFHSLPEEWWKKGSSREYFSDLPWDLPLKTVKCHAPYSHFIMIESSKLRKLGLCECWSEVSLLIDEDWGLSALREGLYNIWIPSIFYTHVRKIDGTRATPIITKRIKEVSELFIKKWGFPHNTTKHDLKKIKDLYGNTNIMWSFDRKSFEWDYLK